MRIEILDATGTAEAAGDGREGKQSKSSGAKKKTGDTAAKKKKTGSAAAKKVAGSAAPAPAAGKRGPGRPSGSGKKKTGKKVDPKKRGPKPKPVEYIDSAIDGLTIREMPLSKIDMENEQFRFRVNLRTNDLEESLSGDGQQFPVVLRREDSGKYQIISGFRRIHALRRLGWEKVKAVVRKDLGDDSEACRISILENELRQTYNDLDRAYAILAYRRMGKSDAEIQDIFRVGARQRQRLEGLVTFPKALQEAVADGGVSSTHAVKLMQHARKYEDYPAAKINKWTKWITENKAGFRQLAGALADEFADEKESQPVEVYVVRTRKGEKSVRLRPISIHQGIDADRKKQILGDLREMISLVEEL